MKQICAILIVGLCSVAIASATGISDNFESYAPGVFPSPPWLDVATVLPGPGQPSPSAFVTDTTDAFGNPTQALGLLDAVSLGRGIYFPVPVSATYSLASDIRVDRYSDKPGGPAQDWAMQLTFADAGLDNFAFTPQAGIYASSLTGTWRLFLIGGPGLDQDLGIPATIGTWYRVQLDFDVNTSTFRSQISDILTGNVLVDKLTTVAGLTPADTPYNSIAFFGGETTPGDTVADQAVVDNINISATGVVPEPPSIALTAAGIGLLILGRRRLRYSAR
jgi:hypothetical protein